MLIVVLNVLFFLSEIIWFFSCIVFENGIIGWEVVVVVLIKISFFSGMCCFNIFVLLIIILERFFGCNYSFIRVWFLIKINIGFKFVCLKVVVNKRVVFK